MDSLKNSDRPALSSAAKYAPRFADRGRFRGHRGGVITMHRALTSFVLEPLNLITASLLVLLFSFAWIVLLPWLCRMWRYVLENGMKIRIDKAKCVGNARCAAVSPGILSIIIYGAWRALSADRL